MTDCDHCHGEDHDEGFSSRRLFLKRALGGLLGLTIGAPVLGLMAQDPRLSGLSGLHAADPQSDPAPLKSRVKSVILLWMDGGPSQLDTFDPKPGTKNGGPFRAIRTAQPGLMLSEHLPRTAEMADRLCVVRSMTTAEGNHSRAKHLMQTGYAPQGTVNFPGLGSMVAHTIGPDSLAIPGNVAINAPGLGAGFLGVKYNPFYIADPGKPVQNLQPPKGVSADRLERRLSLLAAQQASFEKRLGGGVTQIDSFDQITRNATAFMHAPEARAFDISQESEATRAAYGDSRFGRGCLMARRLVEAGVPFVEVSLGGWDTHDDNFTRVAALLKDLDPGYSSLVADLAQRGLLDSTLVVWMGEFGRTPNINGREGRDHFPRAWSVALAGGGVRPGLVGSTDGEGRAVVDRPISTPDLFRTIYTLAGLNPDREFHTPGGRPVKAVDGGRVVPELLGA